MHIYIQFGYFDGLTMEDGYEEIGPELRIFTQPNRIEQDVQYAIQQHLQSLTLPEDCSFCIASSRYEMTDKERDTLAMYTVSRAISLKYLRSQPSAEQQA